MMSDLHKQLILVSVTPYDHHHHHPNNTNDNNDNTSNKNIIQCPITKDTYYEIQEISISTDHAPFRNNSNSNTNNIHTNTPASTS